MKPRVDEDKCEGCENCSNVCPAEVFEMIDAKAVVVRPRDCLDCGTCAEECPCEAIELED